MPTKILFIGNSFSADSLKWLPDILKNVGETDATVAYLFIGGCSIQRHLDNVSEPTQDYTYHKNTGDGWLDFPGSTLLHGITDEPWDIIFFQQASHFSGKPFSYAPLKQLMEFVDRNKTNPNARYAFNMTWAYQGNSTHQQFSTYGNDQMTMYRAICATVRTVIGAEEKIYKIFPTGTVIQNLRLGELGDRLTRDGFHLSLTHGRYAAALSIAYGLGYPIENVTFVPEDAHFSEKFVAEAKRAVINAYAVPFEVTGV